MAPLTAAVAVSGFQVHAGKAIMIKSYIFTNGYQISLAVVSKLLFEPFCDLLLRSAWRSGAWLCQISPVRQTERTLER
jgi:hypothetical protein